MPPDPRIVFLVYQSRSGSTFLSARLDAFADVGVTVESDLMRTLLFARAAIARAVEAADVWDALSRSERFANLGLSRDAFVGAVGGTRWRAIGAIARTTLGLYFAREKPGAAVWVVKDGGNGHFINQIASQLPDARFVHVVRDGRAVLNSLLQTVRPYGRGERMGRDPFTAARLWSGFVDGVDRYAARHPGHCLGVRYEDLIADVDGEIARVRRFVGLDAAPAPAGGAGYYARIPERERTIHARVSGPPAAERTDAWQRELPAAYRAIFERRAAATLRRHGYEVRGSRSAWGLVRETRVIRTYAWCLAIRLRDWGALLARPRRLSRIVRLKAARGRDRRIAGAATARRPLGP